MNCRHQDEIHTIQQMNGGQTEGLSDTSCHGCENNFDESVETLLTFQLGGGPWIQGEDGCRVLRLVRFLLLPRLLEGDEGKEEGFEGSCLLEVLEGFVSSPS